MFMGLAHGRLINLFNLFDPIGWGEGVFMCLVKNEGEEYKILFVGLKTDELGLDTGKEVEGLGLGLAGPVKSFCWKYSAIF